jgi:hypothetical protein
MKVLILILQDDIARNVTLSAVPDGTAQLVLTDDDPRKAADALLRWCDGERTLVTGDPKHAALDILDPDGECD